ncbi:hypothetical protein BV25DRAFT_1922730, partial [Artomyces pyxidatus]
MSSIAYSPRPFPHRYNRWAWCWTRGYIIVAANTLHIAELVPNSAVPTVYIDGLWGPHEWTRFAQPYDARSPFLAFIPLPPLKPKLATSDTEASIAVMTQPVSKEMWTSDSTSPGLHVPQVAILSSLRHRLNWAITMTEDIFPQVSILAPYERVIVPRIALQRARSSFSALDAGVTSWLDFVERFRALQRSLLELTGFAEWWADETGRTQPGYMPPERGLTRGAFVQNFPLYARLARAGVAVYIIVPQALFT